MTVHGGQGRAKCLYMVDRGGPSDCTWWTGEGQVTVHGGQGRAKCLYMVDRGGLSDCTKDLCLVDTLESGQIDLIEL